MRLEIRYVSHFDYDEPVWDSHNVLRACPATNATQRLVRYEMTTSPVSRAISYVDYWGTRVDAFGVRDHHRSLEVVAEAVVETSTPVNPLGIGALFTAYAEDDVRHRNHELLQPSPHTAWNGATEALARDAVSRCTSAVEVAMAIQATVRTTLAYAPGATFVGMDVNDVLGQGKGVCQDFAHATIAMFRAVGVPARYVSGYLYASDQSVGMPPEEAEIEIQTHAWVEVLIPGWGWWALDPTNPVVVGEHHVKIGHGRDYDDVLPLKGVYHGPVTGDLSVSVRMTRDRLGQSTLQQQ